MFARFCHQVGTCCNLYFFITGLFIDLQVLFARKHDHVAAVYRNTIKRAAGADKLRTHHGKRLQVSTAVVHGLQTNGFKLVRNKSSCFFYTGRECAAALHIIGREYALNSFNFFGIDDRFCLLCKSGGGKGNQYQQGGDFFHMFF